MELSGGEGLGERLWAPKGLSVVQKLRDALRRILKIDL